MLGLSWQPSLLHHHSGHFITSYISEGRQPLLRYYLLKHCTLFIELNTWEYLQLLKEKNIRPEISQRVDDVVVALEDQLRIPAAGVAAKLRKCGRVVELVLESKRLKW